MFWERFVALCEEINRKPNPVAKDIGVSSGTVTGWKNGSKPDAVTLAKIAKYFNVQIGYLLGTTDTKKEPATENGDGLSQEFKSLYAKLTPNQKDLVVATMREMTKDK